MKRLLILFLFFTFTNATDHIEQAIENNDVNYLQKICCYITVSETNKIKYIDCVNSLVEKKRIEALQLIPKSEQKNIVLSSIGILSFVISVGAKLWHRKKTNAFFARDPSDLASFELEIDGVKEIDRIRRKAQFYSRLLNFSCFASTIACGFSIWQLYKSSKNLKIRERNQEYMNAKEIEKIIKNMDSRTEN